MSSILTAFHLRKSGFSTSKSLLFAHCEPHKRINGINIVFCDKIPQIIVCNKPFIFYQWDYSLIM